MEPHELPDTAWNEILQLAKNKYQSWEWNYGSTPTFAVRHSLNEKSIRFHVERGYIQKIESEAIGPVNEIVPILETKLIGKRYDPEKIDRLFASG